jgi:hypothetical protein
MREIGYFIDFVAKIPQVFLGDNSSPFYRWMEKIYRQLFI